MSNAHIKECPYGSHLEIKKERSGSRSPRGDDPVGRLRREDETLRRPPLRVKEERSRSRSPVNSIKQEDETISKTEGSKKLENVGLGAKNRLKSMSIQMKLGLKNKVNKRKLTVASVFNQDSDSEPEEVPPEAKMRMRNIGRDTPTSSGPNSFGKTKQGFSDAKKVFEKNLKEAMENALADD